MRLIDTFLAEMEQESKVTRKFLEALPADKMGYKPHEKSMTAGKLAMHVATLPGHLAQWIVTDEFSMNPQQGPETEPTKEAILAAFDKSLADARTVLNGLDDQKAMTIWKFKVNGHEVMSIPKIGFVRSWMFNHLYHHRGQFGVYLRLVGATVPSSYGPSGDENPMAQFMETAGRA